VGTRELPPHKVDSVIYNAAGCDERDASHRREDPLQHRQRPIGAERLAFATIQVCAGESLRNDMFRRVLAPRK
jgi:hypothetical protein